MARVSEWSLDVDSPDDVPGVLDFVAQDYYESGAELDSAHQDPEAGKPWYVIGRELEAAAERIRKKLQRMGW